MEASSNSNNKNKSIKGSILSKLWHFIKNNKFFTFVIIYTLWRAYKCYLFALLWRSHEYYSFTLLWRLGCSRQFSVLYLYFLPILLLIYNRKIILYFKKIKLLWHKLYPKKTFKIFFAFFIIIFIISSAYFLLFNKALIIHSDYLLNYHLETKKETSLLMVAASAGDNEEVKRLINKGFKVNKTNKNMETALHFAVTGDNPEVIKTLLAHGAKIEGKDKNGKTPLNLAISKKNVAALKVLLEAGAQPNALNNINKIDLMPFFSAIKSYDASIYDNRIRIKFNSKTPIEQPNNRIKTAYLNTIPDASFLNLYERSVFFNDKHKKLEIITMLLEYGANPNNFKKESFFRSLRYRTDIPVAEALLNHKINPNIIDDNGTIPWLEESRESDLIRLYLKHGANVQAAWATNQQAEANKNFVHPIKAKGPVAIGLLLYNGLAKRPPLHEACARGDLKLVATLVKEIKNINEKDWYGETALAYAAMNGNVEIIEYLLNNGAEIENRGDFNITPLYYAAAFNNIEALTLLVKRGAKISPESGTSYLNIISIMGENCLPAAEKLLFFTPNISQETLNMALFEAITFGRIEMAEMLMAKGANLKAIIYINPQEIKKYNSNYEIYTSRPLFERVLLHEDLKMANFLLKQGVSFENPSVRTHMEIFSSKGVETVKFYLDNGGKLNNKEAEPFTDFTILANCLRYNSTVLDYLYERGVNLNSFHGPDDESFFGVAVLFGEVSDLNKILDYGVEFDDQNGDDMLMLFVAASSDKYNMLSTLAKRGLNMNSSNIKYPLMYVAKKSKNYLALKLIKESEKKNKNKFKRE